MKNLCFFALIIILCTSAQAKTYTIVVEPIYPTYQSKAVYEPLENWLSEKTGYDIEIIIDINYGFYWKNANGTRMPDFSLDASHVASYRQNVKGYKPLVTTQESVSFHLISLDVPKENQTINEFFIGKKIAMLPKPSYATKFFTVWFPDLFSSPSKDITALSWQDTIDSIFDGVADAAIVPDWVLELYPSFNSLLVSQELPGPTFMSSPNVPADVAQEFKSALLALKEEQNNSYEVLVELNTKGFKEVEENQFADLSDMLPTRQNYIKYKEQRLLAQESHLD